MPRIKEVAVYSFDELDDEAKEKARNLWREHMIEHGWWDGVYDEVKEVLRAIGMDDDVDIRFSGFYSQGDGAHFTGRYRYGVGSLRKVRVLTKDEEALGYAQDLAEIQRRNFYRIVAEISHSGMYQHSGATSFDVYDSRSAEDDQGVRNALRGLMDWVYRRLEQEYEWLTSDEQVDDEIRANDYEFTAEGEIA